MYYRYRVERGRASSHLHDQQTSGSIERMTLFTKTGHESSTSNQNYVMYDLNGLRLSRYSCSPPRSTRNPPRTMSFLHVVIVAAVCTAIAVAAWLAAPRGKNQT